MERPPECERQHDREVEPATVPQRRGQHGRADDRAEAVHVPAELRRDLERVEAEGQVREKPQPDDALGAWDREQADQHEHEQLREAAERVRERPALAERVLEDERRADRRRRHQRRPRAPLNQEPGGREQSEEEPGERAA